MRVNDLTIHDWVRNIELEETFQWSVDDYLDVNTDYVEPIHLTEEILQKNNFTDYAMRNPSANTGYLLQSRNSTIYVNPDKLKFMFRWENNGESVCKRFRYVHELQHLLRLCGLTDLADNFKI